MVAGTNGDSELILKRAGKLGFDGVVSKTIDAPYAPGNRGLWRKAKALNRQEFVVGWSDPEGSHLSMSCRLARRVLDHRSYSRESIGSNRSLSWRSPILPGRPTTSCVTPSMSGTGGQAGRPSTRGSNLGFPIRMRWRMNKSLMPMQQTPIGARFLI
jgi:hypothetical protein